MLLSRKAMKILVLLILAVFTGCNANLLHADEPRSKLDELTDAIQDSVDMVTSPAKDFFNRLQQTKFGQDLSARLGQGAGVVKTNIQHVKKAWSKTPRGVQDFVGGLSFGIYGAAVVVEEKQRTIKKTLEPVAEKLAPAAERIVSVLTEKTQGVRDLASPFVNKLMEKMDSLSKDIPARLDTLYDSIHNSN